MQRVLALSLVLGLATSAQAQTQSFFLHHSDTPLSVPGGTTSFFLDGTAPAVAKPTVEIQIVNPGVTESFPPFISPAFVADTSLLPIASVRLNLSANQKMRACADLATDLFRVDGSGAMTPIGSGTRSGVTIAQGKAGGTVGFVSELLEFPVTDPSILTGQGIAIAPTVTNQCSLNRRVFFAYDGFTAAARVRFQCCFTVSAKCAEAKIKAASKKTTCLLYLEAREAAQGEAEDPLHAQKCGDKFVETFDKIESKGGCLSTGDAPAIEAKVDAFVSDVDSALNPTGPPSKNKCQTAKIKAASKKAKCLLDLEAKAAAKGQFLEPDPLKAQTCREKLTIAFDKLDSKGGCDTAGDAAAIEDKVDAFAADVTAELACPCP